MVAWQGLISCRWLLGMSAVAAGEILHAYIAIVLHCAHAVHASLLCRTISKARHVILLKRFIPRAETTVSLYLGDARMLHNPAGCSWTCAAGPVMALQPAAWEHCRCSSAHNACTTRTLLHQLCTAITCLSLLGVAACFCRASCSSSCRRHRTAPSLRMHAQATSQVQLEPDVQFLSLITLFFCQLTDCSIVSAAWVACWVGGCPCSLSSQLHLRCTHALLMPCQPAGVGVPV